MFSVKAFVVSSCCRQRSSFFVLSHSLSAQLWNHITQSSNYSPPLHPHWFSHHFHAPCRVWTGRIQWFGTNWKCGQLVSQPWSCSEDSLVRHWVVLIGIVEAPSKHRDCETSHDGSGAPGSTRGGSENTEVAVAPKVQKHWQQACISLIFPYMYLYRWLTFTHTVNFSVVLVDKCIHTLKPVQVCLAVPVWLVRRP